MSAGDNFDGKADLHNYLTCIYILEMKYLLNRKLFILYSFQWKSESVSCSVMSNALQSHGL